MCYSTMCHCLNVLKLKAANNSLLSSASEKVHRGFHTKHDDFCIRKKLKLNENSLVMYSEHLKQLQSPGHKSMH